MKFHIYIYIFFYLFKSLHEMGREYSVISIKKIWEKDSLKYRILWVVQCFVHDVNALRIHRCMLEYTVVA